MVMEIKAELKGDSTVQCGRVEKKRDAFKKEYDPVSRRYVSRRRYGAADHEEPEGSRRTKLIEERLDELWVNGRFTAKGNVVGWFLDPEVHEPYWINRKVRGTRRPIKANLPAAVRLEYNKLKAARDSSEFYLTQGELTGFRNMFKDSQAAKEEEQRKKRETSAELQRILDTLKEPQVQAPTDDDAEARAFEETQRWRDYERDAARNNRRLERQVRREGQNEQASLWQGAGEWQQYE